MGVHRRRRGWQVGTIAGVVLFVAMFTVAGFQTLIVSSQKQLDDLNRGIDAATTAGVRLDSQLAELQSPQRITTEATQRLGMVAPPGVAYLQPRPDDDARRPARSPSRRPRRPPPRPPWPGPRPAAPARPVGPRRARPPPRAVGRAGDAPRDLRSSRRVADPSRPVERPVRPSGAPPEPEWHHPAAAAGPVVGRPRPPQPGPVGR